MAKIILFDPKKCTGCKICELICSFSNAKEFSISKARIRNLVDLKGAAFFSLTCFQCQDPPCLGACPSDAIYKEDDVTKIAPRKCTGCRLCISACPFGNVKFDDEKEVAIKCELCGGNPKCVEYCPTEALRFLEKEANTLDNQEALFAKFQEIVQQSKVS